MDRILCLIPLMLALCSCSVKEDRSTCPCELSIRPSEPLRTEGNVLVSVIQDGTVVKQGMLTGQDFENGKCHMTVPRKMSTLTVFTGITQMDAAGGVLLGIRSLHECDEVYSCMEPADLDRDAYDCTVLMHKNFARLDLVVIGMPEGGEMKVKGSVNGYSLVNLDPSEGSFACAPSAGLGMWSLRLPRQTDDSLVMDITAHGEYIGTVPVGKLIAACGYSFDDEDLQDMSVTVDLTERDAMIKIAGWEEGESYSIDF